MSAGQYLFEVDCAAGYLVGGYANAMPGNFANRLSQVEIGHIVAHLLTLSRQTTALEQLPIAHSCLCGGQRILERP